MNILCTRHLHKQIIISTKKTLYLKPLQSFNILFNLTLTCFHCIIQYPILHLNWIFCLSAFIRWNKFSFLLFRCSPCFWNSVTIFSFHIRCYHTFVLADCKNKIQIRLLMLHDLLIFSLTLLMKKNKNIISIKIRIWKQ